MGSLEMRGRAVIPKGTKAITRLDDSWQLICTCKFREGFGVFDEKGCKRKELLDCPLIAICSSPPGGGIHSISVNAGSLHPPHRLLHHQARSRGTDFGWARC